MTESNIIRYADAAMFKAEAIERAPDGSVRPKVYVLEATTDPLGSIAAENLIYAGKVCRDKRDLSDEDRRYQWEQVLATHNQTPLEFVDIHFMIEGVDRAFTHQLVRQRTAVYGQESMRFAVKEDMMNEVPLPPSVMPGSHEATVWNEALSFAQAAYDALIDQGVPAEDARGLMPTAVTTRIHYKTNLRGLKQVAGDRLCTQAQFVWRYVFACVLHQLRAREAYYVVGRDGQQELPAAVNDNWQWNLICDSLFKPICYNIGHCPFNANIDRPCTIRDRVNAGQFDKIHPAEFMLDPTAARRNREDT